MPQLNTSLGTLIHSKIMYSSAATESNHCFTFHSISLSDTNRLYHVIMISTSNFVMLIWLYISREIFCPECPQLHRRTYTSGILFTAHSTAPATICCCYMHVCKWRGVKTCPYSEARLRSNNTAVAKVTAAARPVAGC